MKKWLFMMGIVLVFCYPGFPVYGSMKGDYYQNKKMNKSYALDSTGALQALDTIYSINYDITYFDISDSGELSFSGWSYVDHVDNLGGENLRTWIVAYTGNWNEAWANEIGRSDVKSAGTGSFSEGKYYAVLAKVTDKDLYNARANKSSSDEQQKIVRQATNENDKYKLVKEVDGNKNLGGRRGVYRAGWCLQNKVTGLARCLYYNVGFEVTSLNTDEIIKKLYPRGADKKEVKFRILSSVMYNYVSDPECANGDQAACIKAFKNEENIDYIIDSVDLGVHSSACSSRTNCAANDGKIVKTETKANQEIVEDENGNYISRKSVSTINRIFKVSGLGDEFRYTGVGRLPSKVRLDNRGMINMLNVSKALNDADDLKEWKKHRNSSITKISKGDLLIRNYDNERYPFLSRVFEIKVGDRKYTIPAAWGRVAGKLSFVYTDDAQTKTNSSCLYDENGNEIKTCLGSGCQTNTQKCPALVNKLSCSGGNENNQCENTSGSISGNCGKTITNTYYYRVLKSQIGSGMFFPGMRSSDIGVNGTFTTIDDGTYYYFPVYFYSNIDLNSSYSFQFIHPDNEAGKLFQNNSIEATSGRFFHMAFQYTTSASWNYHGNYVNDTSENNTYAVINARKTNGEEIKMMAIFNSNDQIFEKVVVNGQQQFNLVGNYGVDLFKKLAKDKVMNEYQTSDDTIVAFPDSNDARVVENISENNVGTLTCTPTDSNWEANQSMTKSCTYRIRGAYIRKNDGYVTYDSYDGDENYLKSKNFDSSVYYVPLEYRGDNFKFKISINLTSLRGVNHRLNATCNVKQVTDVLRDSKKVTYRVIDEKNPFPTKSSIDQYPSNWRDYAKENGLIRVTAHSFDKANYKTGLISNKDKSLFVNLKETYKDYGSMYDMTNDGNSKVLRDITIRDSYFKIYTSNENHCQMGKFSPTCDKLLG